MRRGGRRGKLYARRDDHDSLLQRHRKQRPLRAELAGALGDECVSAFEYIKNGVAAELSSERPYVFVSPTYGWQLPRIFAGFIRSARLNGSREAYFVMTCGSEIGNAGKGPARPLRERGLDYRGVLEVVMPENYIALFSAPGPEEAKRIIGRAGPVLERGAELIRRGEPSPSAPPAPSTA